MTVAEYMLDFVEKRGCRQVFMVSGSSAMWLTDALVRNTKLQYICTHHEQAAAMAADAQGRISGVPGVCLVTIGPGATNAITGVAGAYVDSSPMLVISGQASSRLLQYEIDTKIRQHGTQSLNLEPMITPIVKYFAAVMQPEDIQYHMERAFWEATNGRKGPVWIDVPVDIQNRQIPEKMIQFTLPLEPQLQVKDAVSRVLQQLLRSNKPLILAGGGVRMSQACDQLLKLSEQWGIPIVTSRGGIDVIESENPMFVGRPGAYGDRASHFAIQRCDLLLILGSRLSVSTIGYYPDRLAEKAVKIMVDIDEKELAKTDVPINEKFCCNLKDFLTELNAESPYEKPNFTQWAGYCNDLRIRYPVILPEYQTQTPLNSYYVTKLITDVVPEDTAIVVDTGSVCNIVSQSWKIKKGQRYIISGGLSCMGFWASAIGAAAGGTPTVALSGDGSAQMNIQEMATLAHYKLPIKWFIFDNQGYLLIKHNQHNYMNDRFIGVGVTSGVEMPDFCEVAQAYHLPALRIQAGDNIEMRLRELFAIEGPAVCVITTQEFGDIAPRIASKVMPDGSLKAAQFDDLFPFLDVLQDNGLDTPVNSVTK